MPASCGLRSRTANNTDTNVFPRGDYLLPMEETVKVVFMLWRILELERRRYCWRERSHPLQFVILNRGSGKASLRRDIGVKT